VGPGGLPGIGKKGKIKEIKLYHAKQKVKTGL